jgi:D-serine deaminase-like pyridoxal phosphate-dependent protein
VAAVLGSLTDADPSVDVVLRSGAYVVHDDLHYRRITPSTRSAGPTLRSAIHVWASVLSRPELDLAILDAGRRDVPFDLDLPVVLAARRSGTSEWSAVEGASVVRLNDQHAFVRLDPRSALNVGDVVKLGLSHPCTAFDKWRAIPMVESADDPSPRVTDVALTYF